jgi:thiamine pyrophosphate-dependent acetolactate synthase large subunit-like protein
MGASLSNGSVTTSTTAGLPDANASSIALWISCGWSTRVPGSQSSDLWEFNDVDMAKVAEAMGAFGIRVDQPQDIQSAIEEALASGRPAVVDVVTDPLDSEAPIPWSP